MALCKGFFGSMTSVWGEILGASLMEVECSANVRFIMFLQSGHQLYRKLPPVEELGTSNLSAPSKLFPL